MDFLYAYFAVTVEMENLFLIWLNAKSGHVIKYCVPNTTFYSAFDAVNYLDSLWFFNAEFMNIKIRLSLV